MCYILISKSKTTPEKVTSINVTNLTWKFNFIGPGNIKSTGITESDKQELIPSSRAYEYNFYERSSRKSLNKKVQNHCQETM